MVVQAKRAVIHFDTEQDEARVYLDGAEITQPQRGRLADQQPEFLDIPIPDEQQGA